MKARAEIEKEYSREVVKHFTYNMIIDLIVEVEQKDALLAELNQMKFDRMKFDRIGILLKAMVDIVKKLDNTPYVFNFFEQTADCDEYRLFEEAKEVLQIEL